MTFVTHDSPRLLLMVTTARDASGSALDSDSGGQKEKKASHPFSCNYADEVFHKGGKSTALQLDHQPGEVVDTFVKLAQSRVT